MKGWEELTVTSRFVARRWSVSGASVRVRRSGPVFECCIEKLMQEAGAVFP